VLKVGFNKKKPPMVCLMLSWKKERMNGFNTFNLLRQGHVALRGWPKTARAAHAQTKAREAAGGGERNEILDR